MKKAKCTHCGSENSRPVSGPRWDRRHWYRCRTCGRDFVLPANWRTEQKEDRS